MTDTLSSVPRAAAGHGAKAVLRQLGRASATSRPLPDFLVLGAKRGGTTSLWNWLLQHPQVLPPWPARQHLKSPHYFYWHYDRGEAWYRGHFPTEAARRRASARAGGRPVVSGEASPYYLFDPRVPARVAADLPAARLVVLLRNPVDRAASHHQERVNAGVETLPLGRALEAEEGRLAGEVERMLAEPGYYSRAHDWYSYRSRGVYAPQLRAWRAQVPDDRLLVLQSERLYTDPQGSFDAVTDFLGLQRHPFLQADHHNRRPRDRMDPGLRAELAAFYAPHDEELFSDLGVRFDW